jgi:hypothetical protein
MHRGDCMLAVTSSVVSSTYKRNTPVNILHPTYGNRWTSANEKYNCRSRGIRADWSLPCWDRLGSTFRQIERIAARCDQWTTPSCHEGRMTSGISCRATCPAKNNAAISRASEWNLLSDTHRRWTSASGPQARGTRLNCMLAWIALNTHVTNTTLSSDRTKAKIIARFPSLT